MKTKDNTKDQRKKDKTPAGRDLPSYAFKRLVHADVRALVEVGWQLKDIQEYIANKYHFTPEYSRIVVQDASLNYKEYYNNLKDKISEQNTERLQSAIYRLINKGDEATLLKAIDTLNKTAGVYNTNVNIKADAPIFEVRVEGLSPIQPTDTEDEDND